MTADQSPRLTSLSPGAGCACKLPLAKLEALFASMGPVSPASGDLLIGAAEGDDAAVLRLDDERALVLTTDFFTPIVDDPEDWGRIAAANALSDVYAMGGRPLIAVNLAAWPADGLDIAILGRVLRGGAQVAAGAGCAVAGGHTIDAGASEAALAAGVRAATDVTGFGLLGHLHRMLTASRVAARVWAQAVPLLPGAADLAAAGYVSGGTKANTERLRPVTAIDPAVPGEVAVLLHDAQTSGGLLLAAPPGAAPALLADLRARALPAAVIGDVVPGEKGHIQITWGR